LHASAKDTAAKEFSIVIDKPETEYQINVGGARDPRTWRSPSRILAILQWSIRA